MNDLKIFENKEFGEIETILLGGEPLFNPRDVGICLEMPERTVYAHMERMNDNQKVKITNSGLQDLAIRKLNNAGEIFLTESGLYKLIFKSRAPKAESFSDWVTDEVLPSIRETGSYGLNNNDKMELNSSINTLQRLDVLNPYEIAAANNQSDRAKLANIINDIAKRRPAGPKALYEELYYAFAAKSGAYIPEQAENAERTPAQYLREHEIISENLYKFAVNYFYNGTMVVDLINLDFAQKTLGEF